MVGQTRFAALRLSDQRCSALPAVARSGVHRAAMEKPMSTTPPPVREAEFLAVDIADEEEIKGRFTPFVRSLHSYLNQLPCMRDVQETRRRWKARTAEKDAFGNLASHPHECYTYHCGGRNEGHFNICLRPTHFSVGLGFEFTLRKGGDPTAVHLAYACFANVVRTQRSEFERFVNDNQLEIEWSDNVGGTHQFVPMGEVAPWILAPPREPIWICVARFLRRQRDAAILESPSLLGGVMEKVLSGFRPIWEQTEMMAHAQ